MIIELFRQRLLAIIFLVFFNFHSLANETNSNINLDDPYYQLGWKNLTNSKEQVIDIPNSNATLTIVASEIYLDEKETIFKHEEFIKGYSSEEDAPLLIIADRDGYYTIRVEYHDSGYVDIERFKNTKNSEILNTVKRKGGDQISEISWLLEPKINEQIISTNGIKINWSDGDITYQYTSYALGKEGYISLSFILSGSNDDTNEIIEFFNSVINEISSSIIFNEGYKYADHKEDNFASLYTLSNLIDRSFGTGISTDPTITIVYCMPSTNDLKKGRLSEVDYNRFAGKEITFLISDIRNEIADISNDGEVNVLTGMYGPEDKQLFIKEGANLIKYLNKIKLEGKTKDDLVTYDYDNKILFQNGKPKLFSANIDQTGLSFNKWNIKIPCKDEPFSEEEKIKAKRFVKNENSPEWLNKLVNKIERGEKTKERKTIINQKPFNYSLFIEEDGNDYMILFRYAATTKQADLYNYKGVIVYNKNSSYVNFFEDLYMDVNKDKKIFIVPSKFKNPNTSNNMSDYIVPDYELNDFKYTFKSREDDYILEFETKEGLKNIENYYKKRKAFSISSSDGMIWHAVNYKTLYNFNDYKKLSQTNPETICKLISEPLINTLKNKELDGFDLKFIFREKGIPLDSLNC